jgi:hypothetical protein
MGFMPGSSSTTIRHNTEIHMPLKITHHSQTIHSTQRYINNTGHSTHNEYHEKKRERERESKAVPVAGLGDM